MSFSCIIVVLILSLVPSFDIIDDAFFFLCISYFTPSVQDCLLCLVLSSLLTEYIVLLNAAADNAWSSIKSSVFKFSSVLTSSFLSSFYLFFHITWWIIIFFLYYLFLSKYMFLMFTMLFWIAKKDLTRHVWSIITLYFRTLILLVTQKFKCPSCYSNIVDYREVESTREIAWYPVQVLWRPVSCFRSC
jgi:hypothetical protein